MMKNHLIYNKEYKRIPFSHGFWRIRMSQSRLNVILRNVTIERGAKVLDVGCEEGIMLNMLEQQKGAIGYGIDVNREAVHLANHPRISQNNAECLPFNDHFFDLVISSHTIEHLECPEKFLKEAASVTKVGGKLALLYPIEFFPGMTCIPELILSGHSFREMKKIHPQCLNPKKIGKIIKKMPLRHVKSKLHWGFPFIITWEYFTLLVVSGNMHR